MTASFRPDDIDRLQAFRRAAAQVRKASIIDKGQTITIGAERDSSGALQPFQTVLESEPFRSLAMSIRLVYLQKEPASLRPSL